MAALGRNLTAPLSAERDVDVSLNAADGQLESHKGRLRQKAESATDGAAAFDALGAKGEQYVTGRHVRAETDGQGQRANELRDGFDQNHDGHEDRRGADRHQMRQHILGSVTPSVEELRRPDEDGQTRQDGQDESDGRRCHGHQIGDEPGEIEDHDGDHQRRKRGQSQLRLLLGVESGIHPQVPDAGAVSLDDGVVGVTVASLKIESERNNYVWAARGFAMVAGVLLATKYLSMGKEGVPILY